MLFAFLRVVVDINFLYLKPFRRRATMRITKFVVEGISIILGLLGIFSFGFYYEEFSRPERIIVLFLMSIFLVVPGLVNK